VDDRAHYKRAQILVDQRRPKDAESEVLKHLAGQPEDPWGYSLLATAQNMQKRRKEAVDSARKAIELLPTESWFHYVLGDVHYAAARYREARVAVEEAIRLNPKTPRYWGLMANVEGADGKWEAMLVAAETGLEHDGAHQHCRNLRALALAKLGKRDEASALFSENLSDNPENALTFAYQGWTHLHNGEPDDAISSFSESLRLQPMLDWARMGMMTALRDRYWLFVLSRALSPPWMFAVLLVGWIAAMFVTIVAWTMTEQLPLMVPVAIAVSLLTAALLFCYIVCVLPLDRMTDETLALLMLFDSRGQYLLTEEERRKAWRNAALSPLGFLIAAGLVAFSSHKKPSDAGFIMLMFCLMGICYAALGLKFITGRHRDR
jgi:tetratricopeptide (TPR) repeat protein